MKRILRAGLPAVLAALAAGCVLPPVGENGAAPQAAQAAAGSEAVEDDEGAGGEPAAAGEAQAAEAELPGVPLDRELLYQILIGEMAAGRGQMEVASEALLDAARLSRDARLAQRATDVALQAQRYDLAMQAATLWVELRPGGDQPRESLALIMVEQGRLDAAHARFKELLDKHEADRGNELRRIARLLSQLSNREHALKVMDRIVETYQDNPDAHFAEAFLADRAENKTLVLRALDRALELRPGWEEAAQAKLGHLIQEQYPRERIDAFASEFFGQRPEATRLRIGYARYLIDQEAIPEALEQFERVLEHDPENTTGLLSAGLLAMQQEEYKAAQKYLARHLELTPDNDQIRLYLGQVAEERGQYAQAEKWYREVSDQQHRFDARLRLATVIQEREGTEDALEHLASLSTDNEQEFVRLTLTKELVLRNADELPRAMDILDDAVARYPANGDLLYARGLLAAQLDRIVEHEQDMRTLLEEDPNNAHALNALGYTLADATDRTEEAYDLIKKALSMRPQDPFILDSMGWVQYRLGNHTEAIDYLERALAIRDDAEIAAHLGEVLWVTGEKARAREIWEAARKTDPDNRVLKETLERFAQ